MIKPRKLALCTPALLLLLQTGAVAQNIKVAIAANLQPVIKALQADFKKRTSINIDAISGASGNLTSQIKNGAPFDVFLSADLDFPNELYKSKLAANAPVVYAEGILILCSTHNLGPQPWSQIISFAKVKRIAIANPQIAPYGKAATQALKHQGLSAKVNSKLVTGESIGQVNTYIATGAVEAGFTTLSFYKENSGKHQLTMWSINPKSYLPIQQGMVLLKHGAKTTAALKFYRYILSTDAKKIFVKYGYHIQ